MLLATLDTSVLGNLLAVKANIPRRGTRKNKSR